MGSRKNGCPKKQKPCARWLDADRIKRSASGDPAMVFSFRMASIPSQVTGTLPVRPSGRIAAGLQFEHDRDRKTGVSVFRVVLSRMSFLFCESRKLRSSQHHAKTRANRRACTKNKLNDEYC